MLFKYLNNYEKHKKSRKSFVLFVFFVVKKNHNMKNFFYIFSLVLLAACDDGDIVEKYAFQQEGIKVAVDATISGLDSWPDGYSVTLSGFALPVNDKTAAAEYSEISKQIINNGNGTSHITLGGIPQSVNYLEITVLNRIRQRVVTLWQKELTNDEKSTRDTLKIDAGAINAGMYNYIQQEYFNNSCANCHGLGEHAAAGLYLTEGKSYAAMVNVKSSKRADINLVTPGDTAKSVLHKILKGEFSEVKHNHSDKLDLEQDKILIDNWIMSGAGAE
jgi:LEA14-like dessication related protein